MPLRAVIFDVDGVLVRSMERHHEAYQRAFDLLGERVQPEEVYANEGRRSREVIEAIARDRGIALSPERIEALARAKQEAFYAFGPLPLYPGVPELVARIRGAGLGVAAVTGTNRVNVAHHLGPLMAQIGVVVASEDVARTKPDPEPYLAALAKLGLPAADALVVENAVLGVRSAKAAGLRVVAVTSTQPAGALAQADAIVPRVADVWGVVEAELA